MIKPSNLLILPNFEATKALGKKLGQNLPKGSVLLLKGDLGAGKTTLVQGIGEGLGIHDPIVSPTFTLINEYQEGRLPLYHLDLYRLEPDAVSELYLEQYWEEGERLPGITAIEWPEKLSYLPLNYLEIQLSYIEGTGRQVILQPVGDVSLDLSHIG
ncbi:putative ATPase, cell wall biosynthesis [Crocosphaera subtropica ATCC 51142]|uniref:tRNA threonylcarbamoyladenosine biosynthesis protein TsaE n=1 Tax=Crocosphaera subtropica (strain ATCC 51142 / BH68) TaxID=43989 RepID=B1WQW4_CROS5|nr:tRNA (adenosine(37)-N6)-threonylcarbamoyltransferase complex ATPase subunit type 1 TsaE [Crocosphaera subtropica]ACB53416.1 putative ATPase, cell wall biosynthesis [Crocosphaera subtropica ATCC 51142]